MSRVLQGSIVFHFENANKDFEVKEPYISCATLLEVELLSSLKEDASLFRAVKSGEVSVTGKSKNGKFSKKLYTSKAVEAALDAFINDRHFNSILREDIIDEVENDMVYFSIIDITDEKIDCDKFHSNYLFDNRKSAHCRATKDQFIMLKLIYGNKIENVDSLKSTKKFLGIY